MAAIGTGADILQVYLTGAAASGAQQSDPDAALGGFRSRNRVDSLTVKRGTALGGLTVHFASGANGEGVGVLTAADADTVRWCNPGGSIGVSVAIAYGEILQVPSDDEDAYIIVERTTEEDLEGADTIQLRDTYHNWAGTAIYSGSDSIDYQHHRAGMLYFAADVTACKFWIDADNTMGLKLWAETPVSGEIQTIANQYAEPSGVSWNTGESYETGLDIGAQSAGAEVGLWIQNWITNPSHPVELFARGVIHYQFTAAGETYTGTIRGLRRHPIADGWFELYDGIDAEPDTDGAYDYWSYTLPFAYALSAGHDHYLKVFWRNKFGQRSSAKTYVQRVDGEGAVLDPYPVAPSHVEVVPWGAGAFRIKAGYFPVLENNTGAADTWNIYVNIDGTDPEPGVDTPETQALNGTGSMEYLQWDSVAEAYLENTPINAIICMERDGVESQNTTAATTTIAWFGPERPEPVVCLGRNYGLQQAPTTPPDETIYVDEAKNIRFELSEGMTAFWADDVLIWCLRKDDSRSNWSGLWTTFSLAYEAVSGAGDGEAVEVGTWTAEEKTIYVNVADTGLSSDLGTHRMRIDVLAGVIYVAALDGAGTVSTSKSDAPAWRTYLATCFQVWDAGAEEWCTGMSLDTSGILTPLDALTGAATEGECLDE